MGKERLASIAVTALRVGDTISLNGYSVRVEATYDGYDPEGFGRMQGAQYTIVGGAMNGGAGRNHTFVFAKDAMVLIYVDRTQEAS